LAVAGGRMQAAGVIRSGRSPARVIAAPTAPADGAWYSQKQVSSPGTTMAPRKRTGAACWLACPAASATSPPVSAAAPEASRGA
jgi:hypothetical protein